VLIEHGLTDISVAVIGNVAIEIRVMQLKGRSGDFQFGGNRYSHIWERHEGGWLVKASQLTPILRETVA